MGMPDWAKLPPGSSQFEKVHDQVTAHVPVWRVSDLRLLSTVSLPPDDQGKHNQWPAEPIGGIRVRIPWRRKRAHDVLSPRGYRALLDSDRRRA